MTTQYFVRSVSVCAECNGDGVVTHPDWADFFRLPDNASWTQSEVDVFFNDRGYDMPPDEEIPCSECGGTGRIESEAPLLEALAAVGWTVTP